VGFPPVSWTPDVNAAELVRPLPEGSFFALLAEHGDRIVRDEDFAEC
jgi:hypothetical protein